MYRYRFALALIALASTLLTGCELLDHLAR